MNVKTSGIVHLNRKCSMVLALIWLKAQYIQSHNHHKVSAVHILDFFYFAIILFSTEVSYHIAQSKTSIYQDTQQDRL